MSYTVLYARFRRESGESVHYIHNLLWSSVAESMPEVEAYAHGMHVKGEGHKLAAIAGADRSGGILPLPRFVLGLPKSGDDPTADHDESAWARHRGAFSGESVPRVGRVGASGDGLIVQTWRPIGIYDTQTGATHLPPMWQAVWDRAGQRPPSGVVRATVSFAVRGDRLVHRGHDRAQFEQFDWVTRLTKEDEATLTRKAKRTSNGHRAPRPRRPPPPPLPNRTADHYCRSSESFPCPCRLP